MDNLSNDVLLEIFDYLDRDQLISSLKVNKRWKNLITNSSSLMNRVEIFIRPSNIDTLLTEEVDIPHRNLMVHTHLVKNQEELKDFETKLTKLVENFRDSAEFSEMVFFHSKFFFSFVAPLHNLTHLNLIASQNQDLNSFDDTSPEVLLPKLRVLGLKSATCLLKHFKEHSLEVLKIIDVSSDKVNLNINEFLIKCDKLREIKFMGFIPHFDDIKSFKFQLSSVSILLKGQSETGSESVLQLIKRHKDTLKDLKIIGFDTKDFIEFAINDMNLRKLEVDLTRIRADFGHLKINKSIKRMMLQTIALSMKQMQKVIESCQGIEEFKIVSNSNLMFSNWLFKAATSMDSLRVMYIDSLLGILLPQDLNFKNLEVLTVTKLGGDAQLLGWVQLVSRCPNVKKLIVTAWGQQFMPMCSLTKEKATELTFLRKNNLQFILISLPQLEEIEIRGEFPMTDEVVDALVASHGYSKLRKFTFGSEMTEELMKKLKRFHDTKVQCVVLKPSDIKRTIKRKSSESYR
ncbi:hypothetical protein ACKWTF_015391 [Chironomus riparius]